ncbi:glycoside hydrolase family 47 protein [Mycena galericulata]|nr:glycoside hydrolase family 47 protein [Mycena galericulata]
MRRRTIQYLVLLFLAAVATHLYFRTPSEADPEWSADDDEAEDSIPRRRLPADIPKRDAIVAAFQYAWSAYERDAMGADEYHPISHRGSNLSAAGGIGYTVVDALDTMLLMGLHDEYARARAWVRTSLRFDRDGRNRCFNTFETTIRVLGGLLSAYHLSGSDPLYLRHAVDLADRLLPAFDTPSGLPYSSVDLATRKGIPDQWAPNAISTAEATTLQLEFRELARRTGDARYWHKAERVMAVVERAGLESGLVPIAMNVDDGSFARSEIRLGSRGDSYYEYLLKQYLQTDRTEPVYLKMYEHAIQGIHDTLVQRTPARGVAYVAELMPGAGGQGGDWRGSWTLHHKQDHLVCFLAGSLMLGATTAGVADASPLGGVPPRPGELSARGQRDWTTGVALLEGCLDTHRTATGLSPEIVQFQSVPEQPGRDWHIKGSRPGGPATYDARYMLRPETLESLFLAYRLTGDAHYRAAAWGIFEAIERHARLPGGGYATVLDVDTVPVGHEDKQETFFLSETLKYLFLIFAGEEVLPLDGAFFVLSCIPLLSLALLLTIYCVAPEYVLNTEVRCPSPFLPSLLYSFLSID